MKANAVVIESPKTASRIFGHTRWDALPVMAAIFHCVYFFGMFYLFPRGSALDHARSWLHLLGQHFMEYQRHFAQLHPQSLLPIAIA